VLCDSGSSLRPDDLLDLILDVEHFHVFVEETLMVSSGHLGEGLVLELGLMVMSLLGSDDLGDAVVVSLFEGDLATEGCVLADPTLFDWVCQEVTWSDHDVTLFVLEVLDDFSSISLVFIRHFHAFLLHLGVGPVLLMTCSMDASHVRLSLDRVAWHLVELSTSVVGWSTEENLVDSSLLGSCSEDVSWLDHDRAVFWVSVGFLLREHRVITDGKWSRGGEETESHRFLGKASRFLEVLSKLDFSLYFSLGKLFLSLLICCVVCHFQ